MNTFRINDIKVSKEAWYLHQLVYDGKVIGRVEYCEFADRWRGYICNSLWWSQELEKLMNDLLADVHGDCDRMTSPTAKDLLATRGYALSTTRRHLKDFHCL